MANLIAYELLPRIFNMSVTAGIVILFVLLARLLLRRAPKVFSYALWSVVLFRLLCPVSLSAGFSLLGLVEGMARQMDPEKCDRFAISHGDCIEDAEYVADLVRERFGVTDILINYVDPVIGAHSGPGTMALFFLASER